MAVLFDTSILALLLRPDARPPTDPATKQPVEHARRRVDYLVREISKARDKVIIPTPVLTEILYYAGNATDEVLTKLQQSPFMLAPFGARAAVECADAMRRLGHKGKGKNNPQAKVKFDRQIVAIAVVESVSVIYSDDDDIFGYGKQAGIKVVRSYELDLDPADRQGHLALDQKIKPSNDSESYSD